MRIASIVLMFLRRLLNAAMFLISFLYGFGAILINVVGFKFRNEISEATVTAD